MAIPRRQESEVLLSVRYKKLLGMIFAVLLSLFLGYQVGRNSVCPEYSSAGVLLTTTKPSSKTEFSKNEQTYDAKYWEFQANMNKFGAAYKGDIIRHLMNAYSTVNSGKKIRTVLEFGCSGGYILDSMKAPKEDDLNDDRKLFGVEINPASRAYAMETFTKTIQNIYLRPEDMPYDLNFDIIYTTSVLEHADCPLCELRKLFTKLHSHGALIVGLKNDGADPDQTFAKYKHEPNHHIYTWNALLLANMLDSAGFKPCHAIGQFDAWHTIAVPEYNKDKYSYCTKGLEMGKQNNVQNLWAVAVKEGSGSDGVCNSYKAKLEEILNCQYLK